MKTKALFNQSITEILHGKSIYIVLNSSNACGEMVKLAQEYLFDAKASLECKSITAAEYERKAAAAKEFIITILERCYITKNEKAQVITL